MYHQPAREEYVTVSIKEKLWGTNMNYGIHKHCHVTSFGHPEHFAHLFCA